MQGWVAKLKGMGARDGWISCRDVWLRCKGWVAKLKGMGG